MMLKELSKKVAVLGVLFSLVASPLAMAEHPSIELNKDRSVGEDAFHSPESSTSSTNNDDVEVSPSDLIRDEGDTTVLSPSHSGHKTADTESSGTDYSPEDLTHDEGDSNDW